VVILPIQPAINLTERFTSTHLIDHKKQQKK
jgi:hypothetical protein